MKTTVSDKMLDKIQTITRCAATLCQNAGYTVELTDSNSSDSSYLVVGRPSAAGGMTTIAQLRVATHSKPGYQRAGWLKQLKMLDVRPSMSHMEERGAAFVERVKSLEVES